MAGATFGQHGILINGESLSTDGVPVQTTLLDFIRDRGLTGAKEGCAEGECGACTIVMVVADGAGCAYKAINSCLMFVPAAVGREFYTVEALARDGRLAEVQAAMAAGGGSQCGYCTPGFVMSLFAEQYRPGREGPCDPHALGGNLCRCTGYRPIRDAVLSLGPAPDGAFSERLKAPAPALDGVEYRAGEARFDRPADLEECLNLAARFPDAKWICGATDLGVESNLRFRRWPHLVSLEGVPELREFSDAAASVRIGAALTLDEIERQWTGAPDAVRGWFPLFASPPIRNRATLGGNLATASPIGDSAPLLLALNASLVLSSLAGDRVVPLSSFFTGYRKTQLARGEVIRAIEIPKPFPAVTRFYKVSKRRMDDISTVAAGFSLDWDDAGRIAHAVFAFGGVAAAPARAFAAEAAALGQPWNEATLKRIQRELEGELRPIGDHRGSAAYRVAVAKSLVEKLYWQWRDEVAA